MICFATARELDIGHRAGNDEERKAALNKAALLTPLAKAFATDIANEVASLGIQVHGGMGFIEETGAAQYLRDARILPIYEGTNGIQAIDLVTRKLPLDGGAVVTVVPGRAGRNHRQCPGLEPHRFRSYSATADRSDDRAAIGNAVDGADAAKLRRKRRSRRRRRICD